MSYYFSMPGDDEIARRILNHQSYRFICKKMKLPYGQVSGRVSGMRLRGVLPPSNKQRQSFGEALREQRLAAEAARNDTEQARAA